MELLLFRSLWTTGSDLEAALADCRDGLFDGVEGPVPLDGAARKELVARVTDAGVPFIAELVTGGGYVPTSSSAPRHLDDLRAAAEAALDASPLKLTALVGCDSWSLTQAVDVLGRVQLIFDELGLDACVETHRSRPTFTPWSTRDLLAQLPRLQLTCDFSHWCCVCERLVLDDEPEILALCALHAGHVHARVGYDQGPQVPHPAAPEHAAALHAHQRWWAAVWSAQRQAGRPVTTMTPEFGPDGYLQAAPFTGTPVGSLDEINRWMAGRLREQFAAWHEAW